MKYIYLDASSGLSGDMILAALLDLGFSHTEFKNKMDELGLPVEINIKETKRSSLRALRVDVEVKKKNTPTRKWGDIETLIQKSSFSSNVKEKATSIFKSLFTAEAKVHGHPFNEAHLHEAGADDAIIDIMGCCFLAESLGIKEFYASPLNVGKGWVKTSHGILPVPPPAAAELLKGAPVYSAWVNEELVTPTGAAIVATLVKKFIHLPELSYEKIGYGAGQQDFSGFPNILRIFYGNASEFHSDKKIYTIEANIDDANPQILAAFLEHALELGALDAFLTPVCMKKNRLATKLTVLAETDKIDSLIGAIFKETSSIGVRFFPVARRVLQRKVSRVAVLGEKIAIKTAFLEGEEVNVQPEFSDCLRAAKRHKVPVKKILELAMKEYQRPKNAIGSIEKNDKT